MNKFNIIISHLIWIASLILSIIIAIGIFHNSKGFLLNISIALFIAFLSILLYNRAILYSKKQLESIYSRGLLLSNIILQIFELLFIVLLLIMACYRVAIERFSVFG